VEEVQLMEENRIAMPDPLEVDLEPLGEEKKEEKRMEKMVGELMNLVNTSLEQALMAVSLMA
jgi:hypothetical protein